MASEINVGARVLTSDGKELGTVKEVQEAAFRVDAPRAFDFWLQTAIVKTTSAETVTLTIAEGDVGGYKMDNANDHDAFQQGLTHDLDPNTVRSNAMTRGTKRDR